MHLLQLPPETIIQIFDHVGPSYFRSDLSRLTVSEQWCKFAHTRCYREFYLSQKTLRRLMSSPYAEASLSLIKDSVRILDLGLKGYEDWDSVSLPAAPRFPGPQMSPWDTGHGYAVRSAVRSAWTTELNNDLSRLAAIMKQSRKLRIIRIQAISELHPRHFLLEHRNYLFQPAILAFLSVSNLTSLELDLCGTEVLPYQGQQQGKAVHVCTSIAALLSTLRHLRLRMPRLCADVLKPRQHSANLRLTEVLVNLSLSNESLLTTSTRHTKCCNYLMPLSKADMVEQAQALVKQMEAPKMVRILTHTLPRIELQAFDVLTGTTLNLGEGAEWDADGEAVVDEVEDDESEISDLSSDEDN